ncbi:MAG TPA: hypothetical protein VHA78_00350 [Candidatus Peribacteraceae bacterium]|nr:hypothetical protein [Candidatus Peribacteraceae bacterium]
MAFLNGPERNEQFDGIRGQGRVPGPLGHPAVPTTLTHREIEGLHRLMDDLLQLDTEKDSRDQTDA